MYSNLSLKFLTTKTTKESGNGKDSLLDADYSNIFDLIKLVTIN